jgi:F420-0:gamma-glutamyl ligase
MSADKTPEPLTLTPLRGVPLVAPGDDLAGLIMQALATTGLTLQPRDVLILAQKIVSKAEGRLVRYRSNWRRRPARTPGSLCCASRAKFCARAPTC